MAKVNSRTRALPGSATVSTIASIEVAVPASGFQPDRIVHPSQIPAASDRYTWRVLIASPIASSGGRSDSAP